MVKLSSGIGIYTSIYQFESKLYLGWTTVFLGIVSAKTIFFLNLALCTLTFGHNT